MSKNMIDDILKQIISLTDDEDQGDKSPEEIEIESNHGPEEHEIELKPEEATVEVDSDDDDEDLGSLLSELGLDHEEGEHEEGTDLVSDLEHSDDDKDDEPKRGKKPFGTMRW